MLAAEAAYQKKADNIIILDLRQLSIFTDFFIICQANSEPQVEAVMDFIQEKLSKMKIKMHHIEGADKLQWVLMDYDDFVVHIFLPQVRNYYELEKLWGDSEKYAYDNKLIKL